MVYPCMDTIVTQQAVLQQMCIINSVCSANNCVYGAVEGEEAMLCPEANKLEAETKQIGSSRLFASRFMSDIGRTDGFQTQTQEQPGLEQQQQRNQGGFGTPLVLLQCDHVASFMWPGKTSFFVVVSYSSSYHNIIIIIMMPHKLTSNRNLLVLLLRLLRRQRIKRSNLLIKFRISQSQPRAIFSHSDRDPWIANREILLFVNSPSTLQFVMRVFESLRGLFLDPSSCVCGIVGSESHGRDEDDGDEDES